MKINFFEVFTYYRDKTEFIRKLSADDMQLGFVLKTSIMIIILLFTYGFVIGIYHTPLQALSAGIKLSLLYIVSILICFPTFFVIQTILGSRIRFVNLLTIILSGTLLSCWILIAFIPISIFFMLTGGNYYFMQLLHIVILAFSGFFGMKLIVEALKYNCENENIYPKTGVTVFRVSVIIFLFVSIQLGWNLRPFLSKKTESFTIFRQYDGNFYTAVLYSFDKIINPQNEQKSEHHTPNIIDTYKYDSTKDKK